MELKPNDLQILESYPGPVYRPDMLLNPVDSKALKSTYGEGISSEMKTLSTLVSTSEERILAESGIANPSKRTASPIENHPPPKRALTTRSRESIMSVEIALPSADLPNFFGKQDVIMVPGLPSKAKVGNI
jgi:hypothetical protein